MLLLSAWGLFDFREWLHNDAGQKTVDVLIRIALILFFSAIGWTVLASLIENRLASISMAVRCPARGPVRC